MYIGCGIFSCRSRNSIQFVSNYHNIVITNISVGSYLLPVALCVRFSSLVVVAVSGCCCCCVIIICQRIKNIHLICRFIVAIVYGRI